MIISDRASCERAPSSFSLEARGGRCWANYKRQQRPDGTLASPETTRWITVQSPGHSPPTQLYENGVMEKDAEARFEDQISKLVLEKQELEWEKESLQHQTETLAKQHTESLTNVKKQFQAKIRNIEEEKGKYQVSAELKDKEINNLKEELKSLQLLKYNLSKKSSELEQKLALQSRSKDSHLNQLGEVEKRFSALSRQCAIVKQAHEKLEQDVDEAMKMNKKLTSANGKQEATILSLKKETEMNRKLADENVTLRAEKQEVMRSLQHAQQLLLSQTQTVSRVELEMQNQRELHQGLKQEHEVMREKSKALEDKVAQLMESYAASKTSWDKERAMFLDRIKSEQEDLQAVTEAYDELQQKHTELSSQTQHIYKLEVQTHTQTQMTGSSQSVSTQVFPSLAEEIREEETLNEPIFSLEHSASIQTKTSNCVDDTGAVTVLVDYEATGGQDTPNHHQQSQFKQPPNLPNMFTCSLNNNNLFSVCSLSGTVSASSTLNKYTNNSDTDTSTVSSPANDGSGDLLRKEKRDEGNGGMSGENDVTQGKNNKKEEINGEQQWNTEEVQGDDVKEGGSAGGKRGTLMAHTADRADRQEASQRSTEDTGDTKQPETETKDRAEGEGTDGAEERAKKGLRTPETPETQIMVETTTDMTTGESNAQRVIDFMDTEPPLAACEPTDSLSQTVSERDADSTHVKKGFETDSCQEPMKSEDAEDAMTTKSETDFKLSIHQSHEDDASPETGSAKCCEQCPTKELLLDDTNELSLPRNMTYRSSFDWASFQRKTGSHMSEQNTSDPGGVPGHPPSTIPMFLKNKHRKVPLVITKASDLLNASSVSGTAASLRRHHQGEWKAVGETCRETAAVDAESRPSLSISSYPVSTSSIAVSKLSWQTTPGGSSVLHSLPVLTCYQYKRHLSTTSNSQTPNSTMAKTKELSKDTRNKIVDLHPGWED
ncbi:hypothetical protein L3Q82_024237 [Scortum barcoo]|uniref:Uncharacterized protein n=1 Tax=Scortum barcoo TaxID=214431 RepID=A0ACB8WVC9_9TELE|nr:hypothetical protein L3Q82_024237 [Scortum barcoo]